MKAEVQKRCEQCGSARFEEEVVIRIPMREAQDVTRPTVISAPFLQEVLRVTREALGFSLPTWKP